MRRTLISQWLSEGEGPRLDFKLNVAAPYKIARNIVAFANTKGGALIIGVNDTKQVMGTNTEEQQYALEVAAQQFCTPPIELSFEVYITQGKNLLIASVAESAQKPHYAIDKSGQQKIYVRIGDQCVEPSPLLEEAIWSGDLTRLSYNFQLYKTLKEEIRHFIYQNNYITVEQYSALKQCSARLARRTLFDLMLDGFLRPYDNEESFVLTNKLNS